MSGAGLKVLVLADSRSFHTERYVTQLESQGCRVLTASLESGTMEHHLLGRRGPVRALHYPLAATEVVRLVQAFDADLINPHFASGYGFLTALVRRRLKIPVLLHLWGSDVLIAPKKSFLHRRKTSLAIETADAVVADSDYLLAEAGRLGRLKAGRTIAMGIERGALENHKTVYDIGHPMRVIVPRVHEEVYNNLFIVRALADLVKQDRIELTFPNFGGRRESFGAAAGGLVGDKLKFYDKLTRPEYLKFAARHDVYLSASLSDSSPVSMLEAMGLGLIPVVGDIPGVREWLTPDSGYLFDLGRERTLYRVVSDLIERDDPHDLMRRSNLERVGRKAIFEDNIAETIAIMHDLVKENRS